MRTWVLAVCTLATGAAAAAGSDVALDGNWVGSRNGMNVTWELTDDGRLRIDGRGADYVVHGDTLEVEFDPADPGAAAETAIYRFTPEEGVTRLFVYGFDLGKQGLLLTRTRRPELAEDAAPPAPPPPADAQPPRAPGRP